MATQPLPRPAVLLAVLALVPALSACASTGATGAGAGAETTEAYRPVVRRPAPAAARDPRLQMMPGLEGVIGATQGQLVAQFGQARLDVWEGDARKLQFSGSACVLDVYLYPTSQSREPIATYVDARRGSDGKDVDRAACVRALRGQ